MKQKWRTDCKSYYKGEIKNFTRKSSEKPRESIQQKFGDKKRRDRHKKFRKRRGQQHENRYNQFQSLPKRTNLTSNGGTLLLENGRPVLSNKRKREFSGSSGMNSDSVIVENTLKEGFPLAFLDENNFDKVDGIKGNKNRSRLCDPNTLKRHKIAIPSIKPFKIMNHKFDSISKSHGDFGFCLDSDDEFTSDFTYKRDDMGVCVNSSNSMNYRVQDSKRFKRETVSGSEYRTVEVNEKEVASSIKLGSRDRLGPEPDVLQSPRVLQLKSDNIKVKKKILMSRDRRVSSKSDNFKGISVSVEWNGKSDSRRVVESPENERGRKSKKRSRNNSETSSGSARSTSSGSESSSSSSASDSYSSSGDSSCASDGLRKRARHRSNRSSDAMSTSSIGSSSSSSTSRTSSSSSSRSSETYSNSSYYSSASARKTLNSRKCNAKSGESVPLRTRSVWGNSKNFNSRVRHYSSESGKSSNAISRVRHDSSESGKSSNASSRVRHYSSESSKCSSTSSRVRHYSTDSSKSSSTSSRTRRYSSESCTYSDEGSCNIGKSSVQHKNGYSRRHKSGSDTSSFINTSRHSKSGSNNSAHEKKDHLSAYSTDDLRCSGKTFTSKTTLDQYISDHSSSSGSENKGMKQLLKRINDYQQSLNDYNSTKMECDLNKGKTNSPDSYDKGEKEIVLDKDKKNASHFDNNGKKRDFDKDSFKSGSYVNIEKENDLSQHQKKSSNSGSYGNTEMNSDLEKKIQSTKWCNEFLVKYKSLTQTKNGQPQMNVIKDADSKHQTISEEDNANGKNLNLLESRNQCTSLVGEYSYYVQTSSDSDNDDDSNMRQSADIDSPPHPCRLMFQAQKTERSMLTPGDGMRLSFAGDQCLDVIDDTKKDGMIEQEKTKTAAVLIPDYYSKLKNSPRQKLDVTKADFLTRVQYLHKDVVDKDVITSRRKLCSYSSSENDQDFEDEDIFKMDIEDDVAFDTAVTKSGNSSTEYRLGPMNHANSQIVTLDKNLKENDGQIKPSVCDVTLNYERIYDYYVHEDSKEETLINKITDSKASSAENTKILTVDNTNHKIEEYITSKGDSLSETEDTAFSYEQRGLNCIRETILPDLDQNADTEKSVLTELNGCYGSVEKAELEDKLKMEVVRHDHCGNHCFKSDNSDKDSFIGSRCVVGSWDDLDAEATSHCLESESTDLRLAVPKPYYTTSDTQWISDSQIQGATSDTQCNSDSQIQGATSDTQCNSDSQIQGATSDTQCNSDSQIQGATSDTQCNSDSQIQGATSDTQCNSDSQIQGATSDTQCNSDSQIQGATSDTQCNSDSQIQGATSDTQCNSDSQIQGATSDTQCNSDSQIQGATSDTQCNSDSQIQGATSDTQCNSDSQIQGATSDTQCNSDIKEHCTNSNTQCISDSQTQSATSDKRWIFDSHENSASSNTQHISDSQIHCTVSDTQFISDGRAQGPTSDMQCNSDSQKHYSYSDTQYIPLDDSNVSLDSVEELKAISDEQSPYKCSNVYTCKSVSDTIFESNNVDNESSEAGIDSYFCNSLHDQNKMAEKQCSDMDTQILNIVADTQESEANHRESSKNEKHNTVCCFDSPVEGGGICEQVQAKKNSDKKDSISDESNEGFPKSEISSEVMELILQRRNTLEQDFEKDCQVFVSVCQFLLSKDPSLQEPLLVCMQKCLEDLGDGFAVSYQTFVQNIITEYRKH